MCVSCLEPTIRQWSVHCLLVAPSHPFSLLSLFSDPFPFVHMGSFLSFEQLHNPVIVALHAATCACTPVSTLAQSDPRVAPHAQSTVRPPRRSHAQSAVRRHASHRCRACLLKPFSSLFVPSRSKPALPLFSPSFPLSRSHTTHTHSRSILCSVRLLVPTPVA